jgi:hypothetical protein
MRRRLFTALLILSLVLCAATAGMWVRSYFAADSVTRPTALGVMHLTATRGVLVFGVLSDPSPAAEATYRRLPPYTAAVSAPPNDPGVRVSFSRLGFGLIVTRGGSAVTRVGSSVVQSSYFSRWAASVRFPVILLMACAAAAFSLVARRRLTRRSGDCLKCGYNLTGNTSGVCPECGTPTTTPTAADCARPVRSVKGQ